MPYGPLAIVGALTLGDYLLWNWSLNANHDVLALVSGLTLPPLAIVCIWLLALTVARLLASTTRSSKGRQAKRARHARTAQPSSTSARSSRKIAA